MTMQEVTKALYAEGRDTFGALQAALATSGLAHASSILWKRVTTLP